ncbi:dermonecrotic toxin StSicTox-betaIB1i-like [Stegodyphus dumicola]|uniref:dermonecrotic toxin StSicTox-betaIB1i-like n=1 Tax=Stegodyphus dumicola TaxID=202533 RepID=UPI0015B1DBE2|nr:dermonecrotic toxin StSicTox-betaIB1i-like [Stegodyphus dumicola]
MSSVFMMKMLKRYQSYVILQMYVFVLCIYFKKGSLVFGEGRRPLYIIAHMVNSIYEMDEYLARGANAIEADVTFSSNGTIKNVYHGYPCDCYRVCDEKENFASYLNHIRDLSNPKHVNYHDSLTLLFLDLKLSDVSRSQKYKAGEEIAKYLITHLWSNNLSDPQISVLLSIGHTSDSETIRGIQDTFTTSNRGTAMQKLGFDVGLNDDLNSIRRMWSKLGVKNNRWQGDGITNCLRPFREDSRLRHAIRIRDSGTGFIDKVYDWTVDITSHIRRSLRSGVDAILTNFPERVVSVLQEKEFKEKYRLATASDNPFSRVRVAAIKNKHQVMNMNTYVSTMREITIALMGYAWDFYKLRLKRPGTLFPLIQEFFSRTVPVLHEYRSTLKRLSRRKTKTR